MRAVLRYGPTVAAVLAVSGGVWWLMDLRADRAALRLEVAELSRELGVQKDIAAQKTEAAAVMDAHRAREAARAADLQRGLEALLTGDFKNADVRIDPRIADYLDCLRRAGGADPDGCAGGLGRAADPGADQ